MQARTPDYSLDLESKTDKAKKVLKEGYVSALAVGTVSFVAGGLGEKIPYVGPAVGPVLKAITNTVGQGASVALAAGVSRSVTPWDPSADLTPSSADSWKATAKAYFGKYSLKGACLGTVAFGANYLNETLLRPLLGNDPAARYANDCLLYSVVVSGSQFLEYGAVKAWQRIEARRAAESKAIASDVAVATPKASSPKPSQSGMFSSSSSSSASSSSSLTAPLLGKEDIELGVTSTPVSVPVSISPRKP